jgi:hypothetical protein
MPYSFNPFSGNFDNTPSTLKGDTAYSNLVSNSATWVESYNTSTIYKTNSGSYATIDFTNNKFFPLSGGLITGNTRINGDVTIFGNLTSTGTQTFANTIFSTTSALSVVHVGSGPAIWIGNNGSGDIASFYDLDQGVEVFHVGGANGDFPNVGVKTSSPNKDFTVNGEISAVGNIWTTGNIISGGQELLGLILPNINNTYNTVQTNSGNWNSVYSSAANTSADWDSVYSNVNTNSAVWSTDYIQRFDYIDGEIDYSYSGIALEGTSESTSSWKITRLTFSDTGSLSTTGVAQNVAWTERLTATYI